MRQYVVLGIIAVVCGCGQDDNDNDDSPAGDDDALPRSDPLGRWLSQCKPVEDAFFDRVLAVVGEESLFITVSKFDDSDCSDPVLNLRVGGRAQIASDAAGTGVWNADVTIDVAAYTPLKDYVADSFNRGKFCNLSDWKAGKETSVAGDTCNPGAFPGIGDTQYDSFKTVGDRLYLGVNDEDHPGDSPETRPVTFESEPLLRE